MANDTTLTITGNLTSEPELRFTQSGTAVANFTIASTPRSFDKNRNEWTDGDALFLRCTAWRELAEHVAESLPKGTRVIASGRLTQRSYTPDNGVKRTVVELTVDDIGPSLVWATAKVSRARRTPGGATERPPATAAGNAWTVDNSDGKPPF